jgi:NAD(P)-dependent dehydrogenase (short-subunit alcohol dehydrogenase family)
MGTVTPDFTGEVAFVTGASGGMGRAISVAFATAGATVVTADVDADGGAETARLVQQAGAEGCFVKTDVSDGEQVAAAVAVAVERFGQLDCAVNAAAIENETVPLHECDEETFDRMQRINLRGLFLSMKHELSAMLAAGRGGAIVNIASTNSFRPQPNQPAYTASKHGALGLTRSAAIDYAAHGIRINAICPGSIDTPMLRSAIARRGRDPQEVATRLSLLGRFGTPDEIAAAALWLCSDDSGFTLGHALAVDAGYLAR